jgi:hypothetical protein
MEDPQIQRAHLCLVRRVLAQAIKYPHQQISLDRPGELVGSVQVTSTGLLQ